MIIINSQSINTIADAAKSLNVSAKTIKTYIQKGIIPRPDEIQYGIRTIQHYSEEYLENAHKTLEAYREKLKNEKLKLPKEPE
ncbi:MAG: hypothetical protein C0394_00625 [Syntrophus sp. (in: bacteria)]|nr:hypothetical protein [Syntrophus sp. (in: bacteria)]